MRQVLSAFRVVGTAGIPLGFPRHQRNRSPDLISVRSSLPPLSDPYFHALPKSTSQGHHRLAAKHLGRICKALPASRYLCTQAKRSSPEAPYITAMPFVSKTVHSVSMRSSISRYLSTTTVASSRVWLARLPERRTVWRSVLGWGNREAAGSLIEVLLPGSSGAVTWAVGGLGVLAVSEGKLFGSALTMRDPERSASACLTLREIIPESVEVSNVSANDFTRHCSRSQDLGIPLALGVGAAPRSAMHAETGTHPRFVKVAAGAQHFAVLTSHGVLYTWGRGGSWGAGSPLGHGDNKHRSRPTAVGQFIDAGEFVVDVACGTASTCAVTSSGKVFSSGAADFGINGSGMLVSSRVFKELEFFQRIPLPAPLETKRRIEENQLSQLEKLREEMEENGVPKPYFRMRHFETSQDLSAGMDCSDARAGICSPCVSMHGCPRFPMVMCGNYHCGLLTPDGALWMWGRNDCLQLSRDKPIMASGGESNYPLLAESFTRADVPLESFALGPCHSLALARNGAVFEWGGPNAESTHTVDLHWSYPESIFKSPVRKVVAGGFSSSTGFSGVLTERGEAFLWGPGVPKMRLGHKGTEGQLPERLRLPLGAEESRNEQSTGRWRVVDIYAGQQGCLFVTTDSTEPLPCENS